MRRRLVRVATAGCCIARADLGWVRATIGAVDEANAGENAQFRGGYQDHVD
jgi:hypothetical protein